MTYNVYAIMDKASGLFMAPMVDINDSTAKRNFYMQITKTNGALNYSPSDYDYYRIGKYTDSNGIMESISPFEFICNGSSVSGE